MMVQTITPFDIGCGCVSDSENCCVACCNSGNRNISVMQIMDCGISTLDNYG